jgi:hypothetical protein
VQRVAPVDQHEDRLQQVVAIVSAAGDVQKQIQRRLAGAGHVVRTVTPDLPPATQGDLPIACRVNVQAAVEAAHSRPATEQKTPAGKLPRRAASGRGLGVAGPEKWRATSGPGPQPFQCAFERFVVWIQAQPLAPDAQGACAVSGAPEDFTEVCGNFRVGPLLEGG